MLATAHILLASNMNSTITWSLKAFTYLLPISRLPDSPCFLRLACFEALRNVSKPRGLAGFFGILVASLEFRGVRAETIRVRSAQTGGGWMG